MEVWWLSRGRVLKRFSALRNKIKMFLQSRGKDISVMENTDWIADLGILTGLSKHLNDLSLKLQGKTG